MSVNIAREPNLSLDISSLEHNESLWDSIQNFDLSIVTQTFAERNREYGDNAEVLELECKRFLYLAATAPELEIAPTKPIDEYWHQFVLFTQLYEDFCDKFVGEFVHHNPIAGPHHKLFFERTQRMVTHLFGNFANRDIWFLPMPATSCRDFCTGSRRQ